MWSCGSHVGMFQGFRRGHCKELALAAPSPHCCPSVLLPSPTLPLALALGSPNLFITNSERHRNIQQASITVFSSTCIQRNRPHERLPSSPVIFCFYNETPASSCSDAQYQMRTNSVCRDRFTPAV